MECADDVDLVEVRLWKRNASHITSENLDFWITSLYEFHPLDIRLKSIHIVAVFCDLIGNVPSPRAYVKKDIRPSSDLKVATSSEDTSCMRALETRLRSIGIDC